MANSCQWPMKPRKNVTASCGTAKGRTIWKKIWLGLAPSIADVAAMARPVLEHRMALSFAARARGETLIGLIDRVTSRTLRLEAAA